jgi:hypothetical protein
MKEIWKNRRNEREEQRIIQEQQKILESMLRSNASFCLDESKVEASNVEDQFYNMIIKYEDQTEADKVIQDLTADVINKKDYEYIDLIFRSNNDISSDRVNVINESRRMMKAVNNRKSSKIRTLQKEDKIYI